MKSPVLSGNEVSAALPQVTSPGAQRRWLIIIVLLWSVIYIPPLFRPPLLDDADSIHAEAAREILVRSDWVTLHVNGIRYLEKAPLMYWGMAASFKLFGVSEWAARLPLTMGMLALLLVVYALGKRSFGSEAGVYAAVIMATGFGPYVFTRILIPDLLVALWLALGLLFFLRSLEAERPSRLDCWGLAATAALNVLTKGLIGLVFPSVIIVGYLALTRNLKHLLQLRLLSSSAVFLLIAAPWHILAGIANPAAGAAGGFFWFYFINEHFLRYLNKRVPRDYDTVPLLVFWILVLAWVLPWSAFIIQAISQALRRVRLFIRTRWLPVASNSRVFEPESGSSRASLLFVLWAVVIIGFFSFSTRQEYYTIPALPAVALLIGAWLAREVNSSDDSPLRRAGRASSAVLFAIGLIVFIAAMLAGWEAAPPPAGYDLADLLKKNPEEYALSFGHIFDLTPQAMGAFRVPLMIFGGAFLLGTATNWLMRRRGSPRTGNAALALMMVVILGCVHAGLVIFSPILESKQLAMAIKTAYRPGDVIVIDGEYESGSTLNFYTGQQVHVLNGVRGNLWYGSFFPDSPRVYETDSSFARLWQGSGRVFFFAETERPKALEGKSYYELARHGGKRIFVNRPYTSEQTWD